MSPVPPQNPVFNQIYAHASVRKYKTDPLPADLVTSIVAAGQRAASSSNLQMYSAVAVTQAGTRARLAELCGNQKHIAQAPVFIAWCADLSRLERICHRRSYQHVSAYTENFLLATVDTALLMQNAVLAAESLGLGTCYIGSIRNHPQEVIELLALPELVFPLVGMTVGWPAVEPRQRPRLPTRAVLHWERYSCAAEPEALDEYDQAMVATGIYKGRQVPLPGNPDEMQDYGWQEHSARRVSQVHRPELRHVLESQGFHLK